MEEKNLKKSTNHNHKIFFSTKKIPKYEMNKNFMAKIKKMPEVNIFQKTHFINIHPCDFLGEKV